MILIALAGPFAQRRFVPKSDWITASDFNSVLKAIFDKGNGSAKRKEKHLADVVDNAEQAVAFFWNDIKVAARALLKHETRRRLRIGDPPAFALAPLRAARDRRGRHRAAASQRTRQRGA